MKSSRSPEIPASEYETSLRTDEHDGGASAAGARIVNPRLTNLDDPLNYETSWRLLCFDGATNTIYSRVGEHQNQRPDWKSSSDFAVGYLPESVSGAEATEWVRSNIATLEPLITGVEGRLGDDAHATLWHEKFVPALLASVRATRRAVREADPDAALRAIRVAEFQSPLRLEASWWIVCYDAHQELIYSRVGDGRDRPVRKHGSDFEVGGLPEVLTGAEVTRWIKANLAIVLPFLEVPLRDDEADEPDYGPWEQEILRPMLDWVRAERQSTRLALTRDESKPVELHENNDGELVVWDQCHYCGFDATNRRFESTFAEDALRLRADRASTEFTDTEHEDLELLPVDGGVPFSAQLVARWHPATGVVVIDGAALGSAARKYLGSDAPVDG